MSPISCVYHRSGTVQVNWSRPNDSGSTENARLENRKLFKILFKLLYLSFPPLQIRTCVFSRPVDTIRNAILTCARKPTWVGLIYRTLLIINSLSLSSHVLNQIQSTEIHSYMQTERYMWSSCTNNSANHVAYI